MSEITRVFIDGLLTLVWVIALHKTVFGVPVPAYALVRVSANRWTMDAK